MKTASETSTLSDGFGVAPATTGRLRTPSRANDFYELTKPRLNFLVLVTTMVGYYMAVRVPGDWVRVIHTLVGTALTAAGASVLNQVIERKHDKLMLRTQMRPLPDGRISVAHGILYGCVLGIAGVAYLIWFVNGLTAILGAFTILSYLFVYTPMKRWTSLNTVVGGDCGGDSAGDGVDRGDRPIRALCGGAILPFVLLADTAFSGDRDFVPAGLCGGGI